LLASLRPDLEINFANESVFLDFSSDPDRLSGILKTSQAKTIFIDEVQRLPSLLNTIQAIIDKDRRKHRFLLSGSSARKLRRGQANLLPGRVISYSLGSLHLLEIDDERPIKELLSYGTLPGILTETNKNLKKALLSSYAGTYLKEEIQAEALTKNIEGFSRFIFTCAAKNGEFLDYAKLGSLASVTQKTASRFLEILEDTLIIRRLHAHAATDQRRLIRHPKFYFFDVGVLNGLLNNFMPSLDRIGNLFETFVFNQISSFVDSLGASARFSTYRTQKNVEVDFILEIENTTFAIEVKSSRTIASHDLSGLQSFLEVNKKARGLVICLTDSALEKDGISVLPLKAALQLIASTIENAESFP